MRAVVEVLTHRAADADPEDPGEHRGDGDHRERRPVPNTPVVELLGQHDRRDEQRLAEFGEEAGHAQRHLEDGKSGSRRVTFRPHQPAKNEIEEREPDVGNRQNALRELRVGPGEIPQRSTKGENRDVGDEKSAPRERGLPHRLRLHLPTHQIVANQDAGNECQHADEADADHLAVQGRLHPQGLTAGRRVVEQPDDDLSPVKREGERQNRRPVFEPEESPDGPEDRQRGGHQPLVRERPDREGHERHSEQLGDQLGHQSTRSTCSRITSSWWPPVTRIGLRPAAAAARRPPGRRGRTARGTGRR